MMIETARKLIRPMNINTCVTVTILRLSHLVCILTNVNEEPSNWISPSAVNTLKINGCVQVFINTVNVVISRYCFAEDGTDLFII